MGGRSLRPGTSVAWNSRRDSAAARLVVATAVEDFPGPSREVGNNETRQAFADAPRGGHGRFRQRAEALLQVGPGVSWRQDHDRRNAECAVSCKPSVATLGFEDQLTRIGGDRPVGHTEQSQQLVPGRSAARYFRVANQGIVATGEPGKPVDGGRTVLVIEVSVPLRASGRRDRATSGRVIHRPTGLFLSMGRRRVPVNPDLSVIPVIADVRPR
jgi:hypothetical protein